MAQARGCGRADHIVLVLEGRDQFRRCRSGVGAHAGQGQDGQHPAFRVGFGGHSGGQDRHRSDGLRTQFRQRGQHVFTGRRSRRGAGVQVDQAGNSVTAVRPEDSEIPHGQGVLFHGQPRIKTPRETVLQFPVQLGSPRRVLGDQHG